LNVPPRADGTLDAETEQFLASIGRWLAINGEAIYETRPWVTCGQGNVRFTRKPDAVYVIVLNWPETGNVLEIPELGQHWGIGPIAGVTLLGTPANCGGDRMAANVGRCAWYCRKAGRAITPGHSGLRSRPLRRPSLMRQDGMSYARGRASEPRATYSHSDWEKSGDSYAV
ncbi:MAG TPA: hypothetical protein VE268_04300, partial [Herpetosiphonaceae bacterium]|nr:hypothetical protein [Herpetosiphonaceae bacterium]